MQIVEGLGPKLFHFHADDVNAKTWRDHRTLGTGIVDWQRLLKYLAGAEYKGAFAIVSDSKSGPTPDPAILNALGFRR